MQQEYTPHTQPSNISPNMPVKPSKEHIKSILSTVGILVVAPVIAILLTMYVFRSYQVDGPSMQQTLQNEDRLIIWKLPRTWARITGHDFIPERGEIIVFKETETLATGRTKEQELIKRVIALPGERIVINSGIITVYNGSHPDGFQPDKDFDFSDSIPRTDGNIDLVVPDGKVFVCGDNRTNSKDSRVLGPIDADNIIGELKVRITPVGDARFF
jgi:signal peptidase I